MRDLPGGMHSSIRAPRNGEFNWIAQNKAQRILENPLDSANLLTIGWFLARPAVKLRPVICDIEPEPHHLACLLRGQTRLLTTCRCICPCVHGFHHKAPG